MEYILKRSNRKTVAITITREPNVLVRAPLHTKVSEIETMLSAHSGWIEQKLAQMRDLAERRQATALTPAQIALLKQKAALCLPPKVYFFSKRMGVMPTGIKITSAATRWGSCSGRNSLCFSYRVMLLPEEAIDSIVVHELAHIRVKNHGPAFYREVETYLPDYRKRMAAIRAAQAALPF